MVGLDEALQGWLRDVQRITDLTPTEQSKITQAGAKVFQERLEEATRNKHYDTKRYNPKRGHLADGLETQMSNADGRKTGVSTVGWSDGMNATIARWLNDGTKKMAGSHFVTEIQQSKKVLEEVLAAEKSEYDKLIRKRR